MSRPGERGAVTAELAVAIPVLLSLTVLLVWLLSLGLTQMLAIDAARETARAAARGDPDPVATGQRILPEGRIGLSIAADQVIATATVVVPPPGLGLGPDTGITVRAEAVALLEPSAP